MPSINRILYSLQSLRFANAVVNNIDKELKLDTGGLSKNNKEFYFKWPNSKKKRDFFYSNKISYNEFIKIYKFVDNLSDKDWKNKIQNKINDIIIYDKNNKIFREAFLNLGCDNNYFKN